MSIKQLVQCWINGNRTDVIDHILGLDNPAQVAYYAANISKELHEIDDWHSFLNMLADRM